MRGVCVFLNFSRVQVASLESQRPSYDFLVVLQLYASSRGTTGMGPRRIDRVYRGQLMRCVVFVEHASDLGRLFPRGDREARFPADGRRLRRVGRIRQRRRRLLRL